MEAGLEGRLGAGLGAGLIGAGLLEEEAAEAEGEVAAVGEEEADEPCTRLVLLHTN